MCRLACLGLCLLVIGCDGDPVGELIAQLEHHDVEVRRAAALALGEQAAADGRVVAALTKAVMDSDAEVRHASISALGEIGRAARSSLPALERSLQDPELPVRVRAALAIQKIDPTNVSFVPVLAGAMRAGEGRVLLAVGAMGGEAAWAVPTLVGLLSHESATMRALAARTLGRIGPAASEAKAALQRTLRDSNVAVQGAARDALYRIQAQSAGHREDASAS